MDQPTQIGKYVIKNRIGKGGMGDVYLANDPEMNRDVALKLLNTDRVKKPEQFRRFKNEARMLTSLEHRAIVPVYDYGGIYTKEGEAVTQPFLVMRYMPGGSVAQMLKKQRPLEVDSALNIVDRISTALDFAHRKGFIHRDIKPANFLLDEDDAAYLADFGIAKFKESQDTSLTQDGAAIGTYAYMSPEQIKSPRNIDPRSDVYGLGIVLFELFTGQVPFIGDSIQMMYGHLDRDVPRITEYNEHLPDEFDNILRRALAKEPEHRYDTAGELVDELKTASTESVIDLDKVRRVGQTEAEQQARVAAEQLLSPEIELDPQKEAHQEEKKRRFPQRKYLIATGAALVVALLFFAFGGDMFEPDPTATPPLLVSGPEPTETQTRTPTAVPTSEPPTLTPVFTANLRINGNTDTTFWRHEDGSIQEIPTNGTLPLEIDDPLTIQVNANALLFNLPNGDRLFVSGLSTVDLLLASELGDLSLGLSTGGIILESFGQTHFALGSEVTASVVDGRIGIVRTNENEVVEFHCLVGECTIRLGEEEATPLAVGASTAVHQDGTFLQEGPANYSIFTNIIDSVLGALPTETPTPTNTAPPTETPTATRESSTFEPKTYEMGQSVNGQSIDVTQFGDGPNVVIFVGGIHSGYAPNSVQVAESAVTYFLSNPQDVPPDVTMYIITNLNPDSPNLVGQAEGRLNANGVDLNRNWDCRWRADSTVYDKFIEGSGGTAVFSEPETQALKSLIEETDPKAVVVWGASRRPIGASLPGSCNDQTISSVPLAVYYGVAAQYDYPETMAVSPNPNLTGDLTNYLDDLGIPSIFILFPNFTQLDFSRELAGMKAVLSAVDGGERTLNATPTPDACEATDLAVWGESITHIIIRPIGCAISGVISPQAAYQAFQGGWMLWRADQDKVYVMIDDGTRVVTFDVDDPAAEQFEDTEDLKNAFGYVYTTNQEIADELGAPLAPEETTNNFRVQDFTNGIILTFSNDDGTFVVINTALNRWRGD